MCSLKNNRERFWVVLGVGAVALTSAGLYFYFRQNPGSMEKSRKKMVEAMIRETEELIRSHR